MTDPWFRHLSGKFIVFEGPDGSGKTTQFRRFLRAAEASGLTVCEVREPGGTGVGEKIREVLLDHAHKDMTLTCEMLLYMASRAQLIEQKIIPALTRGELVAADRFLPSTLAYQGTAGGNGRLTWGDTHHPAISETNGESDGQFLFINDKANPRIAVIDLRDDPKAESLASLPAYRAAKKAAGAGQ